MAEVSAEARIGAPAGKVWERLTDFASYGEWNATHTSFPDGGPEHLAAGSTFTENMKLMGFPAEALWTVEELEDSATAALDESLRKLAGLVG